MPSTALWFGPEQRARFGVLHVPEDHTARAAVVLCLPLGMEGECARRPFRKLAERLQSDGFIVLRFDYDGTGDSVGTDEDPGRVQAWTDTVVDAAELVRACGVTSVVLIGMRIGATFAAAAARRHSVDALVLWDPCVSGRTFLREQRALWSFSLGGGQPEDGGIEAPGTMYYKETVDDLSALAIGGTAEELPPRILALCRSDRAKPQALERALSVPQVEWADVPGQAEVVEVKPDKAEVPDEAIATIAHWVGTAVPTTRQAVSGDHRTEAVIGRGQGDREIVERIVALGPLGLFGIETTLRGAPVAPVAAFLNSGVVSHVGPARLWVHLVRAWAAHGLRGVRLDWSGLGDSPVHRGQAEHLVFPPEALDDLAHVVKDLAPDDPSQLVLMGLCSGGYHAAEGILALGVGGMCVINPVLTSKPSEIATADSKTAPQVSDRRATTVTKSWARALPAHDALGAFVQRLPGPAWWAIKRFAMHQAPGKVLAELVERGADVFIVCGELDGRTITRGETSLIKRLQRTDHFHFQVIEGIDHELFARQLRVQVLPVLTEYMLRRYVKITQDA